MDTDNLNKFKNFIYEHFGITVNTSSKELQYILERACQHFNCNIDDYYLFIDNHANPYYLNFLIDAITVGETYFFRDKKQISMLQDDILPQIISTKRNQSDMSLRIWSAGCSSGEEIYTVAILLDLLLLDWSKWDIQLLGTDINQVKLDKARLGVYNHWSMRSIPKTYLEHYFILKNKEFSLIPKIVQRVHFSSLNLNETKYPSLLSGIYNIDLILCRNVLIYFKHDIIHSIMRKINSTLVNNGILMLGASDPLVLEGTDLKHCPNKNMVFVKSNVNVVLNKSTATILQKPNKTTIINKETKIIEDANTQPSNNDLLFFFNKAVDLANEGIFEQAEQYFKTCIELDSTHKESYFYYALILVGQERIAEAEMYLKKALFLDHEFIEGHFQLGLLFLKQNQSPKGLKCFENALSLVRKQDPEGIVPDSNGLTYAKFETMLQKEMKLYLNKGLTHVK